MSAQICKYTKKHGIVNCKQVNFIVYEILINKAVRYKTKQNSTKQNKTDGQRTKRKQASKPAAHTDTRSSLSDEALLFISVLDTAV